jgi:hypothetical protein
MREAFSLIWTALVGLFRSRASLAAEVLVLRHQINVLRRNSPKRQTSNAADRLILVGLYRLAPTVLSALAIVKPETVIKWHRAGFRSYWRWKSRRGGGRPTVPPEIRKLIRDMSIANPLWGAPRIHGELLKLGVDIGQTSVAKYMVRRRDPPSQGWRTFLRNHADGIAAMDMFVVPTMSFRLLHGFLILGRGRRQILWFGVTAHPPPNGSQIRSRKLAAGNRLPAISFVTGTGPMVRSSSEGFDRWASAIGRRRRAPLGKMDMLKG